jgi:adenylate cyclase
MRVMPFNRRRLASISIVVATTTLVVIVLHLLYFDPLRKAELYVRDFLAVTGRKAPVDPRLVFLGIDKDSVQLDQLFPEEISASRELMLMGQGFPWSREVYALIQERLMAAGAKLVVFDLVFPQPGPGDAAFRETLERYREQVVLACDFLIDRVGDGMRYGIHVPVSTLVERTEPLDQRMGFDTLFPDPDGVLRRVPFVTTLRELDGFRRAPEDERYESLTARSLRQLGRADLVPTFRQRQHLFRYAGPPGTFRCHSLYELFVPKLWRANYDEGAFFKDKIVMIGAEGSWSHDEHPTPFRLRPDRRGLMAGPEIHLHALNAVLQGEFLREFKIWQEIALFISAGLLAFAVSLMPSAWLRVVVIVAAVAGYALLVMTLFNHAGIFLPFVAPALIGIIATVGNEIADYRRERLEKARLRATLGQYVGEPVVEKLLANPSSYVSALGGVRKPVTVLFSDLRNFTGLTIGRDPTELVEQLNEYFSVMTEHVMDSKGMVDKLMGDSLMAVWGNLHSEGPKADALAAVHAAMAMTRSLLTLNVRWREKGWPEFRFGIGMAYGEALVGNVGSARKMDFTAIGDVTNVASKIQDLTVELECELVVGDSLAKLVKEEFELQAAGPVSLKGRPFAINIFIVTREKIAPPVTALEPRPEAVA